MEKKFERTHLLVDQTCFDAVFLPYHSRTADLAIVVVTNCRTDVSCDQRFPTPVGLVGMPKRLAQQMALFGKM